MINVYCENRGWLFEDLKHNIARHGAVASEKPIPGADAYICVRTREAHRSPKPEKTVVQVHDTDIFLTRKYGAMSFVHEVQEKIWIARGFKGAYFTLPIGARTVPPAPLPERKTLGYFCREVGGKKRSTLFKEAVEIARTQVDFDVLIIGQRLKHLAKLGKYEERGATPADYARITAFMTTSESQMVPLSAYEALAAGRHLVTTPRIFPTQRPWRFIHTAEKPEDLATAILNALHFGKCEPYAPYTREDWAAEQVKQARSL